MNKLFTFFIVFGMAAGVGAGWAVREYLEPWAAKETIDYLGLVTDPAIIRSTIQRMALLKVASGGYLLYDATWPRSTLLQRGDTRGRQHDDDGLRTVGHRGQSVQGQCGEALQGREPVLLFLR